VVDCPAWIDALEELVKRSGEESLKISTVFRMKLLAFCVFLTFSINAEAYLDPGTGSMMLQVILGGVAAIGVAIKLYWHKLRVFLGSGKKEDTKDTSA
jgi:hypothetical protein